jgi:hypothetical protein
MNIARSFSCSSSRSSRLPRALGATRHRHERGEFVASLAHAFVRTGQRIVAVQRRKPVTGEFDFVDRRSNRILAHRFVKDRINAFSFFREIAQCFSPSKIGGQRAASTLVLSLKDARSGFDESAPPLASHKDLTSYSLRQYE